MTTENLIATTPRAAPYPDEDADYAALCAYLRKVPSSVTGPLFTTRIVENGIPSLYEAFLSKLPDDRRHHYRCHTCRRFLNAYGGLVFIDRAGMAHSLLWSRYKESFFGEAIAFLRRLVTSDSVVTGVFLSDDCQWGRPASHRDAKAPGGVWHHMHAIPDPIHVHHPSALSSSFADMAAKKEDHAILCRSLAEYPIDVVRRAYTLLATGQLYRSDKCIGVARWLLDLHEAREATNRRPARENLVWRAVATAPVGYCHVRTTVIATLLDDIVAGKGFADIKRNFDAKMSPVQYQRPQAAPNDGQLAAAERVIAKLASAGSLERRLATLDDIRPHAIWLPKPVNAKTPKEGSVFGHLKTKAADFGPLMDTLPVTVTWDKFSHTVLLPDVTRIECRVPVGNAAFFGFVTAANPDAPPILQWDHEIHRNPVSWYLYTSGSYAMQWGLTAGAWCDVEALTLQPSGWTSALSHQGNGLYFVLRGAKDQRMSAGIALFPETLRSEYHGIRAAIEAYSRSKSFPPCETPACGLALQKSASRWTNTFRVTTEHGMQTIYMLDRWD
jgi:hypothetical protein